jgi:hypothetical protein
MAKGLLVTFRLVFAAALTCAGTAPAWAGERCTGEEALACLGVPLTVGSLQDVSGAGLDDAPARADTPLTTAVILWDEAGKPRMQHGGGAARWTQTAYGVRVELSSRP